MTYTRPYTQSGPPPDGYIRDDTFWYRPGNQVIRINSVFVGGGYRQPIGNRVAMEFLLLYNINDSYNSPYSNPIFRHGVANLLCLLLHSDSQNVIYIFNDDFQVCTKIVPS